MVLCYKIVIKYKTILDRIISILGFCSKYMNGGNGTFKNYGIIRRYVKHVFIILPEKNQITVSLNGFPTVRELNMCTETLFFRGGTRKKKAVDLVVMSSNSLEDLICVVRKI